MESPVGSARRESVADFWRNCEVKGAQESLPPSPCSAADGHQRVRDELQPAFLLCVSFRVREGNGAAGGGRRLGRGAESL